MILTPLSDAEKWLLAMALVNLCSPRHVNRKPACELLAEKLGVLHLFHEGYREAMELFNRMPQRKGVT